MTHLISTALPYVNGPPHIGHAQELVLTDALARYRRKREPVDFLTGTDENSLKNVLAAERANCAVSDFVERHATGFADLATRLGVALDDFIRTSTDPRHAPVVEAVWRACECSGDIYQSEYTGQYCVGCEQFLQPDELTNGLCPEHLTEPEHVAETNYFFRLSRYQQALTEAIETDRLTIRPAHRRNEITAFLDQPLRDLSISRSTERAHGWGLPVPGDRSQVIYVWFDALVNYLSARGFDRWQGADRITHVIGKGVSRFHCVYWPAILLSAGLRLPDEVLIHGYVTSAGGKISKSLGSAVDPVEAIAHRGPEALRYFLLRYVGSHRDADFTWSRLEQAYEHDLANQLGNLVSRTIAVARKTAGARPQETTIGDDLDARIADAIEAFALHRAVEAIWDVVEETNGFVSRREPWNLEGAERLEVVGQALGAIATIARALEPFLPETAERISDRLDSFDRVQLFPRQNRATA